MTHSDVSVASTDFSAGGAWCSWTMRAAIVVCWLLVLAAGCESEEGSGQYDNDARLSDVSDEDIRDFCAAAVIVNPEDEIRVDCVFLALQTTLSRDDCTNELDRCLSGAPFPPRPTCEESFGGELPACAEEISLGELDACGAEIANLYAELAQVLSCDSSLAEAEEALRQPPACVLLEEECPEL